jgi:hypothetical protein
MADIKLFRLGTKVEELKSLTVDLEQKLQTLIEATGRAFVDIWKKRSMLMPMST